MSATMKVLRKADATPPAADDFLSQIIERLRPLLARNVPIKTRIVTFWSVIVESRSLAASDVIESDFRALARETGLVKDLGWEGDKQVDHVIAWGLLMKCYGAQARALERHSLRKRRSRLLMEARKVPAIRATIPI